MLNYVASCMKATDPEGFRWHCDLPGFRTHDGGTVPDQLVQTELRPDICILDQRKERSDKKTKIIEEKDFSNTFLFYKLKYLLRCVKEFKKFEKHLGHFQTCANDQNMFKSIIS